MAIEGPLRELGIHDVFQLLDLSRKTGRLRVTSALRDNEGTVSFHNGRVVGATIRTNPNPIGEILVNAGKITRDELERAMTLQRQPGEQRSLGEILVSIGAITERELHRQIRRQIEAVVFELMSWQEGYFCFAEGDPGATNGGWHASLTAESLLMEAARRIDEWTRIAHRIPSMTTVPALADVDGDHPATLDLRPNEWEVLAQIDGATDLRSIAERVGMSDFDVAKVVFGLLSTGVVTLVEGRSTPPTNDARDDAVMLLSDAREALRDTRARDALQHAERALLLSSELVEGRMVAAQALIALERFGEAERHLERALDTDPDSSQVLMTLARLAVRRGDLDRAIQAWSRVIETAPQSAQAERARKAMAYATRLNALVEVGGDG